MQKGCRLSCKKERKDAGKAKMKVLALYVSEIK